MRSGESYGRNSEGVIRKPGVLQPGEGSRDKLPYGLYSLEILRSA